MESLVDTAGLFSSRSAGAGYRGSGQPGGRGSGEVVQPYENHVQGEGEKEKTRINLRQVLEKISRIFASRSYTQKVQFDLLQAGIPLKGEEYLTIWGGLVLVVPPLCWILTFNLPLAVLVLILGAVIPKLYLQSRIDGRRHKLNQQLGDALTVMANALRAGFVPAGDGYCLPWELLAPISTEFG